MKGIKAVFFDIDGTLVSFKSHQIPASAKNALLKLQENGIKIFIATGRMLPMITVVEDIPFDGYITYNGAYCVNQHKEVIYSNPISKEDLNALLTHLKHDPFPVAFMLKDEMTINMISKGVEAMSRHVNVPIPRREDPYISIQKPVYQLCLYVDDEKEKYILQTVFKHCISNRWSPIFADVNVRADNKK